MPRFFTRIDSTILHAGRPVETIDTDRVAYALLGNDGGAALTRHEAVTAGYVHGLFV